MSFRCQRRVSFFWLLALGASAPIAVVRAQSESTPVQPAVTATSPDTASNLATKPGTATPALKSVSPPSAREKIMYWQVGVTVTPKNWLVKGGTARMPIPSDWPEQKVILFSEEPGTGLKYEGKVIDGGLHILEVDIPSIPKGEKAEMLVTYQIALSPLPPPEQTSTLKKPDKPDRTVTPFLRSTPLIDTRHSSIKNLVAELTKDQPDDWTRIEKMYDWVLANVEMSAGQPVGSVKTVANKKGCREDRINVFVALSRCFKVPARTVWANGMEYAEFYLLDAAGTGKWIPCQLSGPREFGTLPNPWIILQKGEDFDMPGNKDKSRFVNNFAEVSTIRNTRGDPERPNVTFFVRPLHQPPVEK